MRGGDRREVVGGVRCVSEVCASKSGRGGGLGAFEGETQSRRRCDKYEIGCFII